MRYFFDLEYNNIGFLVVEPPIPDLEGRFDSLASDPLLSGVPSAIHSGIYPSYLVSPPREGCEAKGCIVIIPVS